MPDKSDPSFLTIAAEINEALTQDRPVVALESTIISHGMPYPRNVETALRVEQTVREHGAIPATVAILDGQLKVGLNEKEINVLGKKRKDVIKCSRRDIPFALARRTAGATTVAATMIIAASAGIRVFATGGVGGVHRGVEDTLDISADLQELARSNVAVVCAGVKSVLDIGRTLEYLETHGVPVLGYRTNDLPAFYAASSGHPVDYRVENPAEIAEAMRIKWDLQLEGGMLIGNPVPDEFAMNAAEIDGIIADAIREMKRQGIRGKDTTPFLLSRIADVTGGRSLEANIALVLNNAVLAAQVASAFVRL